jgi:hypothetical protein
MGRFQELESLQFELDGASIVDWTWVRCKTEEGTMPEKLLNQKSTYVLGKDDVGWYIGTQFMDPITCEISMSNMVGPIVPGPPRMLEFIISGDCLIGHVARAEAKYIGGHEGPSEFWWIRVTKDGKRHQITDPFPIGDSQHDPRLYTIQKGEWLFRYPSVQYV